MTKIEADIDYNVILHLGYLRNLDLSSRGVYYIKIIGNIITMKDYLSHIKSGQKISLHERRITPVGCFAAPSNFDAKIGQLDLSCPFPIQNGYVEESDKSFRSRSIVVRFRDEIHELNDGVHWRITAPNVDMTSYVSGTIPHYENLILFTMELMFAPLLDNDEANTFDEIDQLIPTSPDFKSIATQTIILQKACSGLHEYYPVTFSRLNFVHLDCMIHSAATSITYRGMEASWIQSRLGDENDYEIVNDLSSRKSYQSVASRRTSRRSQLEPIRLTTVDNSAFPYCCGINDIPNLPIDATVDVAADLEAIYHQSLSVIFPSSTNDTRYFMDNDLKPKPPAQTEVQVTSSKDSVPVQLTRYVQENPLIVSLDYGLSNDSSSYYKKGKGNDQIEEQKEDKKEGDSNNNILLTTPTRTKPIDTPDTSPVLARDALPNMDHITEQAYMVHDLNDSFGEMNQSRNSPNSVNTSPGRSRTSFYFPPSPDTSLGSVAYYKPPQSFRANLSSNMANTLNTTILEPMDRIIFEVINDDIKFTSDEVIELYHLKTNVAIRNFEALHDNVMELNHIIEEYFISQYYNEKERSKLIQQHQKDHLYDFQMTCCLSYDKIKVINEMRSVKTKTEALLLLDQLMEQYNIELTKIWSEFLSSVRKAMPIVRDLLKYEYDIKIRQYWKRQIYVQTCNSAYLRASHPDEDILLDNLMDRLKYEESLTYFTQESDHEIPSIARELRVFDAYIHMAVSKLPVMILQQYLPYVQADRNFPYQQQQQQGSNIISFQSFDSTASSLTVSSVSSDELQPSPSPYIQLSSIYRQDSITSPQINILPISQKQPILSTSNDSISNNESNSNNNDNILNHSISFGISHLPGSTQPTPTQTNENQNSNISHINSSSNSSSNSSNNANLFISPELHMNDIYLNGSAPPTPMNFGTNQNEPSPTVDMSHIYTSHSNVPTPANSHSHSSSSSRSSPLFFSSFIKGPIMSAPIQSIHRNNAATEVLYSDTPQSANILSVPQSTSVNSNTSNSSNMKSPFISMGSIYSPESIVPSTYNKSGSNDNNNNNKSNNNSSDDSSRNGNEESVIRGGYIMNTVGDVSTAQSEDVITSESLHASYSDYHQNPFHRNSSHYSSSHPKRHSDTRKLRSHSKDINDSDWMLSNQHNTIDSGTNHQFRFKQVSPSRFGPEKNSSLPSITPISIPTPVTSVLSNGIAATPGMKALPTSAVDLRIEDYGLLSKLTSVRGPTTIDGGNKTSNNNSTSSMTGKMIAQYDHENNPSLLKTWRDHRLRWKPLLHVDSITSGPMLSSRYMIESIDSIEAVNSSGENSRRSRRSTEEKEGNHLIVLVHGFQGTSQDMRLLASSILIAFPTYQVLCVKSNDEYNEDSIRMMSHRVAEEISQYCRDRLPELLAPKQTYSRVSFIGHSMGGLVIRKALENPLLVPLLSRMDAYISLASPHIGTLLNDSQLISAGMWALSLLKRNKCRPLRELVLEDGLAGRHTHSLIYQLSENGVLQHFHKIVLVSSIKDQYVPAHSAKIQIPKATADSKLSSTLVTMAMNLLTALDPSKVYRIIIDNNTGDNINVDTMVICHTFNLIQPVSIDVMGHYEMLWDVMGYATVS